MGVAQELEVKLRCADAVSARAEVIAAGGQPVGGRRLQHDCLFDTSDGQLRARRSVLRLRTEPQSASLTFKGPPQPSMMKLREELESRVADGSIIRRMLEALGFEIWFRYEKYREEFALHDVVVAVDETPVGTFIELEGTHDGITTAARALGRGPEDYILDSYRGLHVQACERRGAPVTDMVFDSSPSSR
jgi:adenylate cyclase class 2